MSNNITYQGKDFTLEMHGYIDYHVKHHDGAFDITSTFQPTQFNVPIITANGYQIILNIIRKEYLVVNEADVIVSYPKYRLYTLHEAILFANTYQPEELLQNRLPLTRFFEDAKRGMELKRTFSHIGRAEDSDFMPLGKIQTNGMYIIRDGKSSWLELPNSKRVCYNRQRLSVYANCIRLFNEVERQIYDEWEKKRDREAEELDALSDGNSQYWREKYFFESKGYGYLFSPFAKGPLKLDQNFYMVLDKRQCGWKIAEYEVRLK